MGDIPFTEVWVEESIQISILRSILNGVVLLMKLNEINLMILWPH